MSSAQPTTASPLQSAHVNSPAVPFKLGIVCVVGRGMACERAAAAPGWPESALLGYARRSVEAPRLHSPGTRACWQHVAARGACGAAA